MTDRLSAPDSPMRAYYDRRAAEYDSWWLGTGLFAQRDRPGWEAARDELVALVASLEPARPLDLACGTGFLSRALPGELTLLDQSAGMLEIAAGRLPSATVVGGEAIPLPFADASFERVFTSHFYGHLVPDERPAFLAEARRVAPGLIIVDSARRPGGAAEDWQARELEDGSVTRVYKRWFTAAGLAQELGGGTVLLDNEWFVAVSR